jgi:outer membrane protein OmpA-like peptidoglycan-associated protein
MIERQWLQSWFQGTPVRISQRGDGPLDVAVPLEFCFEPGRSALRPALAAVLDKLAESLRRVPSARLGLIAAPGDGRQAASLAAQRGARVRAHLRSRGVAAGQLGLPTEGTAPEVQLRVTDAAAP